MGCLSMWRNRTRVWRRGTSRAQQCQITRSRHLTGPARGRARGARRLGRAGPVPQRASPITMRRRAGSTPRRLCDERVGAARRRRREERVPPRGGLPTRGGSRADRRTAGDLRGGRPQGPVPPSSAEPSGAPASYQTARVDEAPRGKGDARSVSWPRQKHVASSRPARRFTSLRCGTRGLRHSEGSIMLS